MGVTGFTSLTITAKVDGTTIAAATRELHHAGNARTRSSATTGSASARSSKINGATVVESPRPWSPAPAATSSRTSSCSAPPAATGRRCSLGPTAQIIGQNVATAITGVSLSESGSQTGESYTVTLDRHQRAAVAEPVRRRRGDPFQFHRRHHHRRADGYRQHAGDAERHRRHGRVRHHRAERDLRPWRRGHPARHRA